MKLIKKYLSIIFFSLGMFFNSIMDIIDFRRAESIFADWDWFSLLFSLETFILQINDGWHFSKMMMLIFMLLAIVYYKPIVTGFKWNWLNKFADFLIIGSAGVLGIFNLFYDKIWRRK